MQSSGGMATVESARSGRSTCSCRARSPGSSAASGRAGWRASTTSSRSTSAARPPTSASPPAASSACATCSTRRSATTRRWCRWSTSTRSAPAAARSRTSTRAACSASGPQSAGADPGPACYGRGGTLPTSTDAQLVLGPPALRPRAARRGDGARPRARRAVRWPTIAAALGMTVEEAALGALQIQKYGMTQAIELNSVRRGYDPREFTLVAAGGAGPLFACDIALELEIARVLVPPHPGILAATGLLATDLQHEFVATERHALKSLDATRLSRTLRRARRAGGRPARRRRRPGRPPPRAAARRLPLRRPGLRGAHRGAGRRRRRRLGRGAEGALPRRARARVRPPLRRADRDHQHPRRRHRARRRAAADDARSPATGDPSGAKTLEREVVFEVDGEAERHLTPFYERELLRAGDRLVGPGDRRAVRHDDGHPARPGGRDRPPRQHRDRLHQRVPGSRARARRRPLDADPHARHRRRLRGRSRRRWRACSTACRTPRSSASPRTSAPGIFDREGNNLAESDSTPMFMGAMPKIVKNVIAILGEDIHEGDVILHNDPYGGATHSPDVAIVIPIFHEGELVGFAGASAHVLDIGGAYPGLAIDLVDNWSEGNIYRAVKLQEKGVWQAGPLEAHPRERPHAELQQRRHPGDDRGLRAGAEALRRAPRPLRRGDGARGRAGRGSSTPSACCGRRSRRCRTAATRPRWAGSTTTACTAARSSPSRSPSRSRATRSRSTSPARATRCRRATTARSRARPSRR